MNELEKYRGRDGIINLNRLNIELNDFNSFYYNGKKYYIKWSEKVLLLNELVAAEIAKDFGIPSVSYDYARFDFNAFYNGECVISESAFKENDKFYYLREITGDNVTLEDTSYEFKTEIEEELSEVGNIERNSIDILDYLWQNILVEVPLKVHNSKNDNITLKGDGWRFMTEDELNNRHNYPLSDLSKLLDKEGSEEYWQFHLEKLVKQEEI